jgi:hypothetical protein
MKNIKMQEDNHQLALRQKRNMPEYMFLLFAGYRGAGGVVQ